MTEDLLKRESTVLRASQWAALDELAGALGCVNQSGSKAGQPSWRALLYRIAEALAPPPDPNKITPPPDPNEITPLDAAICDIFGLEPTPLWNKGLLYEARQKRKTLYPEP